MSAEKTPDSVQDESAAAVARRPSIPRSAFAPSVQLAGNAAMAALLSRTATTEPAVVAQRDVASDVEHRMSYSATDWVITDEEATDSLNELANLPTPALNAAMAALSQTAKTRLLDNLPATARTSSGYVKVLVAMGPEAILPYVSNLLSYGVFDWAITEADALAVFRILVSLSPAQQGVLGSQLGASFRGRLAEHLTRTATIGEAEHAAVRALFDATPDAELDTLKAWVTIRFRVAVGTQTSGAEVAQAWDGPSLRRLYNVLQALPPGAVESDPDLLRFDRYRDAGPAGGYYGDEDKRVAIGYGDVRALDGVINPANPTGAGMGAAAAMQGQNMFDGVVRHEVGHAVDRSLGLSATYCLGNPAGGNWQTHGAGGLASALVTGHGGAVDTLAPPNRGFVLAALQQVIDQRTPNQLVPDLQALDCWAGLPAATQTAILADSVVVALQGAFADLTPGNPWYNDPAGGIAVGTRVYEESYAGEWHSYDSAARARKTSQYQFRAPGEWIAEAYNAYYAPPTKGAALAAVDPATKAWFDVHVDVASGGEGAAAAGPALPGAATGPGFP